ncbi:MAG: DUF1835 domain-containing protein [Ferruginibacter sp.]
MIHIVFNESEVALLEEVIAMDETLAGSVLQVKDDYAVGPLADLYTAEGRAARREWWQEILAGGDYEMKDNKESIDDHGTAEGIIAALRNNEEETVWIWAAQNGHDVSGYYWLLPYLKEFAGRIFILYLNNLPFLNEKGNIFYPEWLSQIPAKEFLKAKKLARQITLSEFETDPDEWQKLINEDRGVRRLEGGKKPVQHDYDHFDQELRKFITGDWQKASRILHQYLGKSKLTTGDAYLLWRLKTMAAQEMFDMQGEMKNMKDFELKIKS